MFKVFEVFIAAVAVCISTTEAQQCRNTTTRYGDFYFSIHTASRNFDMCQMYFQPPAGRPNVALLLKALHIVYDNTSTELILTPDGKALPYKKRNFYGSPFPAWCGVYVMDSKNLQQPGCPGGSILTDSCGSPSSVSKEWPPSLQIFTKYSTQLLMTYSFVDCPAVSDVPATSIPSTTSLNRTNSEEFRFNNLSAIFLALAVVILVAFIILAMVSFYRKNESQKIAIYTPPMRRAKTRAPKKRGRLNSNSNELVSSTSFSFAAHSRSESLPQVVENQLYHTVDPLSKR